MLIIHHLGLSQSERIVWLCEELDLPYKLVRYDRDPVTSLAPPDFVALHPAGTAPVIEDGDVVLAESGAIIDYIINRHGAGRLAIPPGDPQYPDYLFWFHFANGTLMPSLVAMIVVNLLESNAIDNVVVQAQISRVNRAFMLLDQRLAGVPYLAGESFSAADIISLFSLTTLRTLVPLDLSEYPNILRYLQRVGERPAYLRAMSKAEPGMTPKLS